MSTKTFLLAMIGSSGLVFTGFCFIMAAVTR